MKKLFISIVVALALSTAAYAGVQPAASDANQQVHFVVPIAISTIAADTAIDTGTYMAFSPATDVEMYFGTADTVTFTVEAFTVFGLKPGVVVKLKTETKCLMF